MLLVYKPPFRTPLEVVQQIKADNPQYNNSKITYAGRLDPLAEGLMILLVDEAITQKGTVLEYDKTYEVQVLVGIATDTLDCLGVVTDCSEHIVKTHPNQDIQNILNDWIGSYEQPYPTFSSKTVAGKPLWLHAREGRSDELTVPTKTVNIHNAQIIDVSTITTKEVVSSAVQKIELVNGDFRQPECIASWQSLEGEQQYPIYTLKVIASSGTYMRRLAERLGDELGQPALAFHIRRTTIGPYQLKHFEPPYQPILLTHNVAK